MDTSERSPGRRTRLGIAVLALLNALSAVGGGVSLILGYLSVGPELTARLPWGSAVVGGVALLLCVAVPNAALGVLALRNDDRVAAAAVVVGLVLVGWILVELAFIRELSFFHPLYVGIGLVLILLGRRLQRIEGAATGNTAPDRRRRTATGGVS